MKEEEGKKKKTQKQITLRKARELACHANCELRLKKQGYFFSEMRGFISSKHRLERLQKGDR
jgi:hypothetical protein